jgi:hypothetical protein
MGLDELVRTEHVKRTLGFGVTKMSKGRYAFKLNNATRLLKSAIAAGLPRERLRLVHDPLSNKISVEVCDGSGDEPAKNPWLADLDVKQK